MTAVFPPTLPQYLQTNGFSGGISSYDVIVTSMEYGPSKRRARSKAAPISYSGTILVNLEQLDTFRAFYNDTLGGGIGVFEWNDPITRDLAYFRFANPNQNPPKISPANNSGIEFNVSMELELLP